MTALATPWFEDEPRDLRRWSIAAAIVVAIHASVIAGYMFWHQPDEIGSDAPVADVELAPIDDVADAAPSDLTPAPEEMVEQKPMPDLPKPPEPPKEEPPPPPTLDTTADIPPPEQKPPEKVEEPKPPAPQTAARVKGGAPRIDHSWESLLVRHLQRFKRYPSEAQSHSVQGIVLLNFSVDRNGRVLAHHIVRSSGHPELDNEVTELIERAQPLPPFPANMTEAKLDLTVPIRFSLH